MIILLLTGLVRFSVANPLTLPLGCDVWLGAIPTTKRAEARALRAYEDDFVSWYQFDGEGLLGRADLKVAMAGRNAAFVKRRPDGSLRIARGVIEEARFGLVPGADAPVRIARVDLATADGPLALMVGEDGGAGRDLLDFRLEPTARWSVENPGFLFQERYAAWTPVHYGRREFHYRFYDRDYYREANLLYARVWPRGSGVDLEWTETEANVFESSTLKGRRVALLYRARAYGDQAGRLAQPRIIEGTLGRVVMVRWPDLDLSVRDGDGPVYLPRTLLWEFIDDEGKASFPLQGTAEVGGLADLEFVEPLELRVRPVD